MAGPRAIMSMAMRMSMGGQAIVKTANVCIRNYACVHAPMDFRASSSASSQFGFYVRMRRRPDDHDCRSYSTLQSYSINHRHRCCNKSRNGDATMYTYAIMNSHGQKDTYKCSSGIALQQYHAMGRKIMGGALGSCFSTSSNTNINTNANGNTSEGTNGLLSPLPHEQASLNIAMIGSANAGKSSLTNALMFGRSGSDIRVTTPTKPAIWQAPKGMEGECIAYNKQDAFHIHIGVCILQLRYI